MLTRNYVMPITAHLELHTFSADRVIFKQGPRSPKIGPEKGIKVAGLFERVFGYATTITVGNQKYTVNKKSLAKYIATISCPDLAKNERVKAAVSASFEHVASKESNILNAPNFEGRKGQLLTKHLERSLAGQRQQRVGINEAIQSSYWMRLFESELTQSNQAHRAEQISRLGPESLKPHIRVEKAHSELTASLGHTFTRLGFRPIQGGQFASFDSDLVKEMHEKMETVTETLERTREQVLQLKNKHKLEVEIQELKTTIATLTALEEKYNREYPAYLKVKMILDSNRVKIEQNPGELQTISQELIRQFPEETIVAILAYNRKIVEYQTQIVDLPPKEAVLIEQINALESQIKGLEAEKSQLDQMLGENTRTTISLHEEELNDFEEKSIRTLDALKERAHTEIETVEGDLKHLFDDDSELCLLNAQLEELEKRKEIINPNKVLTSFKTIGAGLLNKAAAKGVGQHVSKPKTIEEEIRQLERSKNSYEELTEPTQRDLDELKRITIELDEYKQALRSKREKEKILAEIISRIKVKKAEIAERKAVLNSKKEELEGAKRKLNGNLKKIEATLNHKVAAYNIKAQDIAKIHGFNTTRTNGRIDLMSDQFRGLINSLAAEIDALSQQRDKIRAELNKIDSETTTLVQSFPSEFEKGKPQFDPSVKATATERLAAKRAEQQELQSTIAGLDPQSITVYYQAKAAAIYNLYYIQFLIGNFSQNELRQKIVSEIQGLEIELTGLVYHNQINESLIFSEALKAYKRERTKELQPSEAEARPQSVYAPGSVRRGRQLNSAYWSIYNDLGIAEGVKPSQFQNQQVRILAALDANDCQKETLKLLQEKKVTPEGKIIQNGTTTFIKILFEKVDLINVNALIAELGHGIKADPNSRLSQEQQAKLAIYQLFLRHTDKKTELYDYLKIMGVVEDYFTTA